MPRNNGHIRLTGEECDEKDKIIAGKSFRVRYLGSRDIISQDSNGKGCTDEATREIYHRYSTKNSYKSLAKRELFISANCVSLYAPTENVVIYRYKTINVTFCNTSYENRNAFAFVVREPQNGAIRVHVVHCENPAQANAICEAMHEAFKVRSALYNAKRVDRAGWENDLHQKDLHQRFTHSEESGDENETDGEHRLHQETNVNGVDNVKKYDSMSNFGEFACAVLLPCETNVGDNTKINKVDKSRYNETDNLIEYSGQKSFPLNGKGFSFAKMLLSKNGRNRSQSLPISPPTINNDCEEGFDTFEEEDDFSQLARERSSSMKLLTAE